MSTQDPGELGRDDRADTNQPVAAVSSPDVRRPRSSTRVPFDGVVEVGGELGPPFEAQAMDVSGTGMHLRTAYLPEVGQAISCRFEAGRETVVATGEVVWQKEAGRGGEFGLRFIDLDAESALALEKMTDRVRLSVPGAKVRLHIEGLGAPMRARVKDAGKSQLTVGSELGFLQVGKPIDLEDAESGNRRPACIDRVEVEIDPSSRIPQLVVSLRYEDLAEAPLAPMIHAAKADAGHAHEVPREDDDQHDEVRQDEEGEDDVDVSVSDPMRANDAPMHVRQEQAASADDDVIEDSMRMKSPVARAASKVTPALERFAKRTKVTAMLLLEKAKARRASESSPIRRTTAPPPGGSLHTAGRKVVRSEPTASVPDKAETSRMTALFADKKKTMMIGASAVMVLAIGSALMTKKAAPTPPETVAVADPAAAAAPAAAPLNPAVAQPTAPLNPISSTPEFGAPSTPPSFTESVAQERAASDTHAAPKKIKVAPFTYGNVSRGNLLRIKMDGAIEKIQGAQQPTGFTVNIPGRRSLEPAAPLAARDARIGSIKVVNDPGGAELAVTFKDGVPNYTVRAKGDQLEIVLATPNAMAGKETPTKKEAKPTTVAKRGKKKPAH